MKGLDETKRLLSNMDGRIELKQRTPEEQAEYQRTLDAVELPEWYQPPFPMSDPTQLYTDHSTLTADEIDAVVEVLYTNYVKRQYLKELAEHGSVEALQLHKHDKEERRESWRALLATEGIC